MAKQKRQQNDDDSNNGTTRKRGKRKPTTYRFEVVDSEGKETPIDLQLTHQASAKAILEYLNSQDELTSQGERYQFTKVIKFQ